MRRRPPTSTKPKTRPIAATGPAVPPTATHIATAATHTTNEMAYSAPKLAVAGANRLTGVQRSRAQTAGWDTPAQVPDTLPPRTTTDPAPDGSDDSATRRTAPWNQPRSGRLAAARRG